VTIPKALPIRIKHLRHLVSNSGVLRGLTELGVVQKELFAAVGLPTPTPAEVLAPAGDLPTAAV
jgi:hypothetical protein